MERYEYGILSATFFGDGSRWETSAQLPDGRREFADAPSLVALNTLGAEGWAMVTYDETFAPAVSGSGKTFSKFWLRRALDS